MILLFRLYYDIVIVYAYYYYNAYNTCVYILYSKCLVCACGNNTNAIREKNSFVFYYVYKN